MISLKFYISNSVYQIYIQAIHHNFYGFSVTVTLQLMPAACWLLLSLIRQFARLLPLTRGRTFVRHLPREAVSVHIDKHLWYFPQCFARRGPLNFSRAHEERLERRVSNHFVQLFCHIRQGQAVHSQRPRKKSKYGISLPMTWISVPWLPWSGELNSLQTKVLVKYLYINSFCLFLLCFYVFCLFFFSETFFPMVTVVVLPRPPCQETPFLARLKRLVSGIKEGNRHTASKRGNQNHNKYLPICLPCSSDLGYKFKRNTHTHTQKKEKQWSGELSTILIAHLVLSKSNKTDKLLNLRTTDRKLFL